MVTPPRGIEDRIDWFLGHNPSDTGMCAQHTWHSLGGDRGNPPAWGASDANACITKIRASGRYWTPKTWSGPPPRGAWVGYEYGNYGHACLSLGDGRIATTDPSNGKMVGIEDLDYPNRWGASGWDVWTDQYNGVRFEVGADAAAVTSQIYSDRLGYGEPTNGDASSDTVKELQDRLNGISLPPPGNVMLDLTGIYDDPTDTVVRVWQESVGDTPDPAGRSYLGEKQRARMFPTPPYTIHDRGLPAIAEDPDPTPEPPDPNPPEPAEGTFDTSWHKYSGKPAGTLTVADDAGYVKVDASVAAAPVSGLEFHMLYANCDLTWDSGSQDGWIRVKYVRDGGDATAYQDYSVVRGMSDFLITAQHWEAGEAGVGGRWYINAGGGIAKLSIGTRYVKAGGVPDSITAQQAAAVSQLLTGLPVPVVRLLAFLTLFLAVLGVALGADT